jgi:glutathione S-transferase
MPKLYGVNASPFVRKVRVALAEKGIAYEHDPVMPFNVSAEFKKLSPLGKVPAFTDGDRTLSDSSVIIAYLEKTQPKPPLYPEDPYEYARALWFEEYGDSALAQVIGGKFFFKKIVGPMFMNQPCNQAELDQSYAEEIPPLFDYLESQLASSEAIAGTRFSIGDIGICTHFVNWKHAGYEVDAKRWPKLAKYVQHTLSRPSFKALYDEEKALFGG